jgi:hypothetical protein
VFPELADELPKYTTLSGALRFPVDAALPKRLVERLVAIRSREALGE